MKPPHEQPVPEIATYADDDLELHVWPPERRAGGQHVGRFPAGVIAVHKATGLAFASTTERSQLANRERAIKELRVLLGNRPPISNVEQP